MIPRQVSKPFTAFFSFLVLVLGTAISANAQLKADFTIDKNAGCSPLTVSFTNTSTGASAAATYKWDFGNGNTSTLVNPGATYVTEKTYTVTLTVTDGTATSTQTKQVVVYKKPVVDFSAAPAKGCLPLPVNFTSTSTAGDGTIANYFWDFGDGNTQQGSSLQQVSHTYNFVQNASVGLTITNSYGCYATTTKAAAEILQAISASFTVDKKVLCAVGDAVAFTNTSTGPGTLSYLWDFGDGTTSTDLSPSHVFAKQGTFNVKLTVTNTDGCSNISVAIPIQVAGFTVDFDVPQPVCRGSAVTFTDKSTTGWTNEIWTIDGTPYYSYYPGFSYAFYTTGSHTVQLSATYGTCTISSAVKTITVSDIPTPAPFIVTIPGFCTPPVNVQFKDTTAGAVAWTWYFNSYVDQSTASTQAPSHTYTNDGTFYVNLIVKNAAGCTANEIQPVTINQTNVFIYLLSGTTVGCDSVPAIFAANAADQIATYKWDFGDGSTSTDAQPHHTFTKAGDFTITLSYTTKSGCAATTNFSSIHVSKKPNVDFYASPGTTICGNTPVTFYATGDGGGLYQWNFGDGNGGYSTAYYTDAVHQYNRDSTYTVTLIVNDYYYGVCADTVTKVNYIKVLPPFPKINGSTNTCDGTRGLVTFKDTSYKVQTWSWNFGDGSSNLSYSIAQSPITHLYTKTGAYQVVLTTTYDQCTVKDSTTVYVLLKQNPVLSALVNNVCSSGPLTVSLSNMETNPAPYAYFWYGNYYYLANMQYGDSTNIGYPYPYQNVVWQNSTNWTVNNLDVTKKDLRVISTSEYFGCNDTSNFIPLKIKGPVAGYEIISNNNCYKSPIIFQDTSHGTGGVPIKTWTWNYGDNINETKTTGGTVSHYYTDPGYYYPVLTVTDTNGCTASTPYYQTYAQVNGPKAAFTYSPSFVSPNTPIYFYNNSNTYGAYNVSYEWIFGDGTTSTDYYPVHSFSALGPDTVKLVAHNLTANCDDTSIQVIYVKNINTSFTYSISYINNNSCPPVIVKFTNTSVNANSVSWDFGDGSTAGNQNYPSHTYTKSGVYKITLYGYGNNGMTDSTTDSITVKGPYAILHADVLSGCLSQIVTLSAQVKNASSFTWDFADGTLDQTKDTFAVHSYLTPGLYTPSLILKDDGGCSSTSSLADTIVIDTLNAVINKSTNLVCDSAWVNFTPKITSLAVDQMHQTLLYKWYFGTGNIADTSNESNPVFDYNVPGKYIIHLQVSSPYGCVKQTTDSITVVRKSKASITGPAEICPDIAALFNGNATIISSGTTWNWDFKNGNVSSLQNPSTEMFTDAGNYNVQLIVNNNGCADTAYNPLIVHPKPVVNLLPQQPVVCLGKSVQLSAQNGVAYSWSPAKGLDDNTIATPTATPTVTTMYTVNVTNNFGCVNKDSTTVTVAVPFTMKVPADTFVCIGSSVQLYANGANTYLWINATQGLSNTQIANPIASPSLATSYTVVGYDAYSCFSDTATINIGVKPLPSVNAGDDIQTLTGSTVQLSATGSSDVISWNWLPPDYLSCSDCPSPVSTPRSDIAYIVTGKTQYGCEASDTLIIKLVCAQDRVYIPDAFTPNSDGKNDVFYIKGRGIRIIKSIAIYSRWGEKVFEKNNIAIDDRSSAWDGYFKGSPLPAGTYVYMAELVCDTGEPFTLKGTVILVR